MSFSLYCHDITKNFSCKIFQKPYICPFFCRNLYFNKDMMNNLFYDQESNVSVQNRVLIPPVFFKDRIFFINNPKFFLVLYKTGKLFDFFKFVDFKGYDEVKLWLRQNHLLNENFLENVSFYSVFCKIKYSRKVKFYVKSPFLRLKKYDLN